MTPGEKNGGIMKKIFMLIIGVSMMPGFALANAYESTSVETESYGTQSLEEARAQEMREDEMRRDEMRRDAMRQEEKRHSRYDVDVDNLRSDTISGASGPRYNSDENSNYR